MSHKRKINLFKHYKESAEYFRDTIPHNIRLEAIAFICANSATRLEILNESFMGENSKYIPALWNIVYTSIHVREIPDKKRTRKNEYKYI